MRFRQIAIPVPKENTLSILFMRFYYSTWLFSSVKPSQLSILFMRFKKEHGTAYLWNMIDFQFSLWDSTHQHVWGSQPPQSPFNSLYEILVAKNLATSSITPSFNSLYEIQRGEAGVRAEANKACFQFSLWDSYSPRYGSPHSYCSFQFSLWDSDRFESIQHYISFVFQFSLWDSSWRYRLLKLNSLNYTFNSLYEILMV